MGDQAVPLILVTRATQDQASRRSVSIASGVSPSESSQHPLLTKGTIASSDENTCEEALYEVDLNRKSSLTGWRSGIWFTSTATISVLVVNTLFTVIAATTQPSEEGIGTLYDESCSVVNFWSVALHVLINALSSSLLSASNYTMQCLAAPTRAEVDKAHARGTWVDIGVPSIRNIFGRVSWKRSATWWVLTLSSVPIHFVFNSAIFKTARANHYGVALVNDQFLEGQPFQSDYLNWSGQDDSAQQNPSYEYIHQFQLLWNRTDVTNLTALECVDAYDEQFLSKRGPLVVISNDLQQNNASFFAYRSVGGYSRTGEPYQWMCYWTDETWSTDEHCQTKDFKRRDPRWSILYPWTMRFNYNRTKIPDTNRTSTPSIDVSSIVIDSCVSMKVPEHCKLQFSQQIMLTVVVCNVLKCAAIVWTLLYHKEKTLVTMGDAIASFLERTDPHSRKFYRANRSTISGPRHFILPDMFPERPPERHWHNSVSRSRGTPPLILCMIGLAIGSAMLAYGVYQFGKYNGAAAFSRGFGRLDPQGIIAFGNFQFPQLGVSGLVWTVLLVNLPQVICTLLYFTYNSLLTSMLMAEEWSRYFSAKKPLRVSHPRGSQRSTYFLSLPYRYSIPLLFVNGTLHWLISQSLFLARVSDIEYGPDGSVIHNWSADTKSQIGYSCLPMLFAILLGFIMVFVLIALGFRKLDRHMPIAGSCSLAIAAAYHRPEEDVNAAQLPVSWGEVIDADGTTSGRCCFTSMKVCAPRCWASVLDDLPKT